MMPSPDAIDAVCLIALIVTGIGAGWLLSAIPRIEVGLIGDWRIVPVREWWRRWRVHGRFWRLYR